MFSLLTVLTVTGLVGHLLQVPPVQGTCVACTGFFSVLTAADLNQICSTQATRQTCYDALPENCKTDQYKNRLAAVDYQCESAVKNELSQQLTNCITGNQATIDKIHDTCERTISSSLTGSCLMNEIRKCVLKSLNACCPNACQIQDRYMYYFIKPSTMTPGCAWEQDSGYCSFSPGLEGVNLLYGLAGGRVSLRGVDLLSCCAVVDVRVDDPLAVSAALRSERGDGCEAGPAGRQRSAQRSVPAGLTMRELVMAIAVMFRAVGCDLVAGAVVVSSPVVVRVQ
ncbi:hypothetical protein ACOMHN_058522 [Nucella lapillus]